MPNVDPSTKPHDVNPAEPPVKPEGPTSGPGHKGPDSGKTTHTPDPGEEVDPRQHPLVERPETPPMEVPPKPRRDLPYSDPERAVKTRAEDDEDTLDATPRDPDPTDEPQFLPWQSSTPPNKWFTQPLPPPPPR